MVEMLASSYDVLLLDLDGVLYAGASAVPHAARALREVRAELGVKVAFVTNNASRTPAAVVEKLRTVGVDAVEADVVTSAQAGAALLAERLPTGSAVLVVGGEGLRQAVADRGFEIVSAAAAEPAAVIQGFSPDVDWRCLAEATFAVRAGATFVATNTDRTIPTDGGIGPGNGLLVGVVEQATGVRALVAGKPQTPLMVESLRRTGATRPLVVGDRLDTDIAGANAAGLPSLLVLTGVSGLADVLTAVPAERPTFIGADLRALAWPGCPTAIDERVDPGADHGTDSGSGAVGGSANEGPDATRAPISGDFEVQSWTRRVAAAARSCWDDPRSEVDQIVEELEAARPAL